MVSIERAAHDRPRFEANIPYDCIEMRWGETASELPKIDLSLRSIIWLDYDGRLSRSVLGDIREVSARAAGGTVLAITVQSKYDRVIGDGGIDDTVKSLVDSLGVDRIPFDIDPAELRGDGTSRLFRRIITEEIKLSIDAKNLARPAGQHIRFKQFLNFRYEDGVKMMTVAFVFFDAGQETFYDLCAFDSLFFFRDGEESFEINIPKLTPREITFLEGQMPRAFSKVELAAIPEKDAKQYANIYRYFPNVAFLD
ncbi:hypothetical protein CN065_00005 [Sinorhizobium meliloti]|nr:O-methyltransferase [Sinorhizobium meliloti]ASQ02358.1 hypothetical protein CDO24_34935 [Sinorhizobium meliloti]MQV68792.1 hypothetical protein [Sinorhizobium meliloti]RVQ47080.1 hypothetical protein CN065_00005 [Sinorhizobium meliloti]